MFLFVILCRSNLKMIKNTRSTYTGICNTFCKNVKDVLLEKIAKFPSPVNKTKGNNIPQKIFSVLNACDLPMLTSSIFLDAAISSHCIICVFYIRHFLYTFKSIFKFFCQAPFCMHAP